MQTLNLTKKYATYPEYKDSGVEWLGRVPMKWNVMRSKFMFMQRKTRALSTDEQLTASQEYGVISQKEFMQKKGHSVVQVISGAEILKHVEPNDFVISMRSFQGGIELSKGRGSVSSAYVALVPTEKVVPAFFAYLLKSKSYIQALQLTSNLVRDGQALRFENFSQVDLPIVPISEQQVIAKYLDEKTAMIDQIITKKQRQIELLREKRTAVINHAVTKGLDPNAELVDSGIEWIGKIPKGWGIEKLKRISQMNKRTLPENTDPGFSFKYFDIGSVDDEQTSDIQDEITFAKAPSRARRVISSGDSIIATVRTYLKAIAFFDIVVTNTIASTGFAVLSPTPRLIPKYLYYYLQSDRFINQVILNSKGIGYPAITPSDLGSLEVLSPEKKLQEGIVVYLDEKISAYNSVIQKAERSVEVLQEFKVSLISHVVTGKVKI